MKDEETSQGRIHSNGSESQTDKHGQWGQRRDSPVGTVFVGLACEHGVYAKKLNLTHRRDRDYIRTVAASHALHAVLCAARGRLPEGFEQIG